MIKKISSETWIKKEIMQSYLSVFGLLRPLKLERCDFVLISEVDHKINGFVTCHEMDSESVYWQFGGIHKDIQKSVLVSNIYVEAIEWCKKKYKRITTRIENTNLPMLRLAMKFGFIIQGVWNFKGKVYLELCNEFGGL